MQLSELQELDVAIFTDKEELGHFIILERAPGDGVSGFSEIQYEKNNKTEAFSWDSYNPEVKYIGKGQIIPIQIIFPKDKIFHYQIEYYSKSDWYVIHVDIPVIDNYVEYLQIIEQLKLIPGIIDIEGKRYKYNIQKAQLFEYNDITTKIIELLSKYYGEPIKSNKEVI